MRNLGNAPLILVKADKGYIMCGYLNIEIAEKLGDAAATVTGVSSIEELLEKNVKAVTSKAKNLGIEPGMKGREALEKLITE
ncbi:MAG TPA: DUF1805 domain-containing protein [Desulfurococcaceae archaeon]|nr:DUF1805 domain-containing protein [Desulfurococcaceae archaeon]